MKSIAIGLMFLLVIVTPPNLTAAEPTYPLRVRGGGKAQRYFVHGKLIVQFSPGIKAAGVGLRPGEGSWLDRGFRPGEPARVEYYVGTEQAAQGIISYLASPTNYYTFECFNTRQGYLHATKRYTKIVRID